MPGPALNFVFVTELLVEAANVRGILAHHAYQSFKPGEITPDTTVAMNCWGFTPDFLSQLENYFKNFLDTDAVANPLKSEFLLPTVVGSMINAGSAKVAVLPTSDRWFGVTYAEDKPVFMKCIRELIAAGVYPEATFH